MFFKKYRKKRNIKMCTRVMLDIISQYEDKVSLVMKLTEKFPTDVIICACYRVALKMDYTIVFKDMKYVNDLLSDENFKCSVIAYDNCKTLSDRKYLLLPFKYTDNLYNEVVEDKDNKYIVIV